MSIQIKDQVAEASLKKPHLAVASRNLSIVTNLSTRLVPIDPALTRLNDLWAEAYERWLDNVEQRCGSLNSKQSYAYRFAKFFKYLQEFYPGGIHPAQVSGIDCQRVISRLKKVGYSNNTINAYITTLSSFYNFVCRKFEVAPGRYLHAFNPMTSVTRLHVDLYGKSQGITEVQIKVLLSACDRSTVQGARDFAILLFYIYTGRRRVEVLRLRWVDVTDNPNDTTRKYYSYRGKGGKKGCREIPPPVWEALVYYLKLAGRLENMRPESALFTSHGATTDSWDIKKQQTERPLSENCVRQILQRAAKKAGIENIKLHSLRHTAAKLRRNIGYSIEDVSTFLDHSNIAITAVYLSVVEAKEDDRWQKVEALIAI